VKRKICFFVHDLSGGGAERVLIRLLHRISRSEFEIDLLLVKKKGIYLDKIPSYVKLKSLNVKRTRYLFKNIFSFFRSSDYDDIIIFNINNINFIVLVASIFFKNKFRFICREATVLSFILKEYKFPLSKILALLSKIAYSRIDKVIALSLDMERDLVDNFDVKSDKVTVIPNPIDFDEIEKYKNQFKIKFQGSSNKIVYVGRIIPYKGIHLILNALSYVKNDYRFYIIGTETPDQSEYKNYLIKLIKELAIEDKVIFEGYMPNTLPYLVGASMLVMASSFEGFPNVGIESNAVGTPIVAFDAPGGLKDIVKNGYNGWLVKQGDIEELANKIDHVIENPLNRDAIIAYTKSRYSIENIIKSYEDLILN